MKKQEDSKSSMIVCGNKIYDLQNLPTEKINLTDWEHKILDARVKGPAITQIDNDVFDENIEDIIRQVCVLTGYKLPEDQLMAAVLKSELITFLLDFGYKLLNEAELALSFRLNVSGGCRYSDGTYMPVIEPVGAYINVLYCARVLGNYMILRNTFDAKLKNIISGY